MLVNFSYINGQKVSMFEKDAQDILKVLKMSGNIPGAMNVEDIPIAIERIQEASKVLTEQNEHTAETQDDSISFKNRAFPLMELFEMAKLKNQPVIWEYE